MNRYWALIIVFAGCLAGGLWSADHYHSKYQQEQQKVVEQKKTLAQQATAITALQTQNAQNRVLMAEQQRREQQLRQQGEIYQRKYQDAIKNNECARRVAPDIVLELLRGTGASIAGADRPVAP